jgi:hypothetical protein
MVSFTDDVNNFGAMHLSNPEVSKWGISFLYYIGTGFFRVLTLMDEGMELP